jgi:hypothetical protein
MARKTQPESERRSTTVCSNDDRGPKLVAGAPGDACTPGTPGSRGPVRSYRDSGDDTSAAVFLHYCGADDGVRFEQTAGTDRVLKKYPIQFAPDDGPAMKAIRVPTLNRVLILAGDEHAIDAKPARLDRSGDSEPAQGGERPGVDRVATQLVARESGAVEQCHPRPGSREDQSSNRP